MAITRLPFAKSILTLSTHITRIACVGAAIASVGAAASHLGDAAQYASNIEAVRTASTPDVRETGLLEPGWYDRRMSDEFGTAASQAVLFVAVSDSCAPCREVLDGLLDIASRIRESSELAFRIIVASTEVGSESLNMLSRLKRVEPHAELWLIRNPEKFRAGTGIVGLPTTVLIDASGSVHAVLLGSIRPPAWDGLERMLRKSQDASFGHLIVDYGETGLPIVPDVLGGLSN